MVLFYVSKNKTHTKVPKRICEELDVNQAQALNNKAVVQVFTRQTSRHINRQTKACVALNFDMSGQIQRAYNALD